MITAAGRAPISREHLLSILAGTGRLATTSPDPAYAVADLHGIRAQVGHETLPTPKGRKG